MFAELRANGITAGFKDLGAGGIMGCSAELCAAGGFGAEVDLDRVSTAQRDLPPEVIAIGETQERLCWIVPPSFTPALLAIYNESFRCRASRAGACAAVIGKVTESGRYVARHRGEIVMDVDLEFLTGGVRYDRPYALPLLPPNRKRPRRAYAAAAVETGVPRGERSARVLAHRDVCSRAPIYQRYDGVVRGCTAIPPGLCRRRRARADPRRAARRRGRRRRAIRATAKSIRSARPNTPCSKRSRNVIAVGARPAGLTDCLNFGDPTMPEQMGAFVAAVDGLAHAARELGVPFVSGNVWLYNRSSTGTHVAPSPIVGCVGTIADVAHTATMGFKRAGSALVVTAPLEHALGGSVVAELFGIATQALPALDHHAFARQCALVLDGLERGTIASAHAITDGGALAAIAKMAFASHAGLGFRIDPLPVEDRPGHDAAWFAEIPAFVVEVTDPTAFAELTARHRVAAYDAGRTIAESAAAIGDERIALADLRETWEAPLRDFYGPSTSSGDTNVARHDSAPRVAVLVFPGTNSEDETLRALHAVGLDAELVHWSVPEALRALRRVRAAGRLRVRRPRSRRRRCGARCADGPGDRGGANRKVRARHLQRRADARRGRARARHRTAAAADGGVRAERVRAFHVGARAREAFRRARARSDPRRDRTAGA